MMQRQGGLNLRPLAALPLVALLLLGLVAVSNSNEKLFLVINQSHTYFNEVFWNIFWQNTTFLGDTLVAIAIVFPLAVRSPGLIKVMLCTLILTTLIIQALKLGLNFPRPLKVLDVHEVHVMGSAIYKRAFPSGHTASAFALSAMLVSYYSLKYRWVVALIGIAVLVGISRVIVGAHWPMDVLAGAAIGWLCGNLSVRMVRYRANEKGLFFYSGLLLLIVGTLYLLLFHRTGYPYSNVLQHGLAIISLLMASHGWVSGIKKGP